MLDSLGIERAHYWGYSMGGWIGFGMAKHAPQRLRALIIGGQHPYERKAMPELPNGDDPQAFLVAFAGNLGVDFNSLPEADKRRASPGVPRRFDADRSASLGIPAPSG